MLSHCDALILVQKPRQSITFDTLPDINSLVGKENLQFQRFNKQLIRNVAE